MSNLWGLDVQQVRALATAMDREADLIDVIQSRLTDLIADTRWVGPDANQFRSDWAAAHSTGLHKVSRGLRDAAQLARVSATAQEQSSQF